MANIRDVTYKLIEKVPDDYIYWLNQTIRKFIADKEIGNEDEKLARWQADPDKYEDEINEYITGGIKASRHESMSEEDRARCEY